MLSSSPGQRFLKDVIAITLAWDNAEMTAVSPVIKAGQRNAAHNRQPSTLPILSSEIRPLGCPSIWCRVHLAVLCSVQGCPEQRAAWQPAGPQPWVTAVEASLLPTSHCSERAAAPSYNQLYFSLVYM